MFLHRHCEPEGCGNLMRKGGDCPVATLLAMTIYCMRLRSLFRAKRRNLLILLAMTFYLVRLY